MKLFGIITALLLANIALAAEKQIILNKTNFVVMGEEFTPESTTRVAIELRKIAEKAPANQPIYLILNTPGGDVFSGLELIENIGVCGL